MPLPPPQLDDKKFDGLVAESTKLIPRQAPEWTDHNAHDPGITLVELFAWLAEMQQFYLNSIGPESYLKFLRLLGAKPRGASPARTEINFSALNAGTVAVLQGTKLTNAQLDVDRQLIFETASPLLVLSIKLKKILTSTRRGLKDNTGVNSWDGLSYFAFGEEAEADSRLYLGFDQAFPAGEQIALTLDLAEDYPVARGRHDDEETLPLPSALVTWEYYNTEEKWVPLEIIGTVDSILSELEKNQAASSAACFAFADALLASVEGSPAFGSLSDVAKNSLRQAIAQAKLPQDVRRFLFDPQFLLAKGDSTLMLSQSGRLFFNAPGDMRQNKSHPFNEELLFWLRATVRQPGFELPPLVEAISINTIDAFQIDTASEVISYSGNGKPKQSFQAHGYLPLYAVSLVQVRERDGRWKDWEAKKNLDSSGPGDLHYTIDKDPAAGVVTITFGDGVNGRIPNQGQDNVRLISYLAEFEEERMLGGSNGLPGQSFALERTNALPETLIVQIQERIVLPDTVIETVTVACLLDFTRTTIVKIGKPVEVVVSLKAKAELCGVTVQENLSSELKAIPGDLPSGKVRLEDGPEQEIFFEVGPLSSGSARTWTYKLNAGAQGGSITGQIVIATGARCPTIMAESPASLVEVRKTSADTRWRDWIRVGDFDASGPSDPHFVFDSISGLIMFGDGINGDIPQTGAGDRNIRLVSLQTCNGETGNVAGKPIATFAEPFLIDLPKELSSLKFSQVIAATGGTASETLEDAQARARGDLRTQYQAVTSADFEFLTLNTPGLRVSRAKAISPFSFSRKPDPRASVTVVVLPYSRFAKPVPSENFLRTVCRHLDRHRLITTQVEVVAPNYVQVTVQATVMLKSGFDIGESRITIIEALNRFLRPIPEAGDTQNHGWPFGRTVYKSEVYQLIENIERVDCVEGISLTAEGSGASRDKNGNITITPVSVVFSGDHQVDILTPEFECRRQHE